MGSNLLRISNILLIIGFPISIPTYMLIERSFLKGILCWSEHIYYIAYGKYWKSLTYKDNKIEIIQS